MMKYEKVKYEMKKTDPRNPRIKGVFKGMMGSDKVSFRFTYSKDMNNQVIVVSDNGIIGMSIEQFNSSVIPMKSGNRFILVGGR